MAEGGGGGWVNENNDFMDDAPDLSTCIFRTWSAICCGTLLKCWCQCCGMCAIGQEDREIQAILARENKLDALRIDYITHEKFADYWPNIQALQSMSVMDFQSHVRALSILSRKILRYALTLLVLYAVLDMLANQGVKFLVMLGVLAQAIIFLYFVHWRWNRFDISLDSVIKYFASGYVIGFFQAMLVELTLTTVYGIIAIIVFFSEAEEMAEEQNMSLSDFLQVKDAASQIMYNHIGMLVLGIFFVAFVVAALVEELVKYYCYFTIETPEMMSDDNSDSNYNSNNSKEKQGKYILIAMVSAALGFACKENMQYVLQSPNTHNELMILLLRSLLPVHPLCAAIMSIGVIRRDVEQDPTWQLGKIILPSVFLHGFYDFTVMLYAVMAGADEQSQDNNDDDDNNSEEEPITFKAVLPAFAIGVPFVVCGIWYYYTQARKQRERLRQQDNGSTFSINASFA